MSNGLAFSGNLDFLSLGEILQIIGNNGGTGVLRIMSQYAPSPGLIFMTKGDPVDAVNGDRSGLEALVASTGADELIVAAQIFDHQARLRSYEIVAQATGMRA